MALYNTGSNKQGEMSFLEHLEALRWHLVRSAIVIVILTVVFFCYREIVFDHIIFAPKHPDFWTYRMLCLLSAKLEIGDSLCIKELPFDLINTELSGQLLCIFGQVLWLVWL